MGHGYRLLWENLRLMIEPVGEHWQSFVYDETTGEVLYRAERMSIHGAKVSGVEFALWRLFGESHGQDAESIAERLPWEGADSPLPV
jgi:hypothetical protein